MPQLYDCAEEILDNILRHTDQQTARILRLVSRRISKIADPYAFEHLKYTMYDPDDDFVLNDKVFANLTALISQDRFPRYIQSLELDGSIFSDPEWSSLHKKILMSAVAKARLLRYVSVEGHDQAFVACLSGLEYRRKIGSPNVCLIGVDIAPPEVDLKRDLPCVTKLCLWWRNSEEELDDDSSIGPILAACPNLKHLDISSLKASSRRFPSYFDKASNQLETLKLKLKPRVLNTTLLVLQEPKFANLKQLKLETNGIWATMADQLAKLGSVTELQLHFELEGDLALACRSMAQMLEKKSGMRKLEQLKFQCEKSWLPRVELDEVELDLEMASVVDITEYVNKFGIARDPSTPVVVNDFCRDFTITGHVYAPILEEMATMEELEKFVNVLTNRRIQCHYPREMLLFRKCVEADKYIPSPDGFWQPSSRELIAAMEEEEEDA